MALALRHLPKVSGRSQRGTVLIMRHEIAVRLQGDVTDTGAATLLLTVPRGNALDHHSGVRSWLRKRMRSSKPKCLRVKASVNFFHPE